MQEWSHNHEWHSMCPDDCSVLVGRTAVYRCFDQVLYGAGCFQIMCSKCVSRKKRMYIPVSDKLFKCLSGRGIKGACRPHDPYDPTMLFFIFQWRMCQGILLIHLWEELALLFTGVLIAYVLFYSFFAHIAYGSCMIYAFLCAYLTLFSSLYIL